jgi:hypothetical protein
MAAVSSVEVDKKTGIIHQVVSPLDAAGMSTK